MKKTNKIETKVADVLHETTQTKHIFCTLRLHSLYAWHVSCITRKCTKDLLYSTNRKKCTEVVSPTRGVVRVVFHKFVATTWNNLYISLVEGEMPRGTTPSNYKTQLNFNVKKRGTSYELRVSRTQSTLPPKMPTSAQAPCETSSLHAPRTEEVEPHSPPAYLCSKLHGNIRYLHPMIMCRHDECPLM